MLKRVSFILILTLVGGAMAGAQDLPDGKALMAKYIEALGGETALRAVETMTETGTLTLSDMGMEAKYTAYTQPPNHVDYSDFEGMGVVRNGVTDGVVWSINPFMGNEARKTGGKASLILFLDWEKRFTGAECVGEEAIGAKACYKVNLVRSEGSPTTVYLDKESGLMIKREITSDGRVQSETYSQYKQVGDIMHPHKFDSTGGPIALSIVLDSVEINVEIPPEKLQFPEEIRTTLEGQGSQ